MSTSKFAWQQALVFAFAIPLSGVAQSTGMHSLHIAILECSLSADGAYSVSYEGAGWKCKGNLHNQVGR
jgi:hypothetical protein